MSVFGGTASVTTPIFAKVNGRVEVRTGGAIIFAEAVEGRETRITTSLAVRPTSSTRVEGSFVRSRLRRASDDSAFAAATIPRIKVEYQPRRSLFFRMISEYR